MTIDKLNELRTSQVHSRSWILNKYIFNLIFNFYDIDVPTNITYSYIFIYYVIFIN